MSAIVEGERKRFQLPKPHAPKALERAWRFLQEKDAESLAGHVVSFLIDQSRLHGTTRATMAGKQRLIQTTQTFFLIGRSEIETAIHTDENLKNGMGQIKLIVCDPVKFREIHLTGIIDEGRIVSLTKEFFVGERQRKDFIESRTLMKQLLLWSQPDAMANYSFLQEALMQPQGSLGPLTFRSGRACELGAPRIRI